MKLVVLLLIAAALFAVQVEEFDARVLKFQRHWDKFLRAQWGCGPAAARRSDCNPTLSMPDLREFRASCEAARSLWDLKGDCR